MPCYRTNAPSTDTLMTYCAMSCVAYYGCHQPASLGGIGLIHAKNTHAAAYISSMMECAADMDKILTATHKSNPLLNARFNVPDRIRPLHDELVRQFPPIKLPEGKCIQLPPLKTIAKHQNGNQHDLSSAINLHTNYTVLHSRDTPVRDILRMQSCGREGKELINTIPRHPETTFPPDGTLYVGAVCMYLGIAIPFLGKGLQCPCGRGEGYMNGDGFHLASQCSTGSKRFTKHHALRDTVQALAQAGGHHCAKESSATIRSVRPGSMKRTDVTVHDWPPKRALELDVTITHPFTILDGGTTWRRTGDPEPEDAARLAEASKDRKYKTVIESAGGEFQPVAIESFGRFGPRARMILNKLKDDVSFRTGIPRDIVNRYWNQRIVISLYLLTMRTMKEMADQARLKRLPPRCREATSRAGANMQDLCW